MKGKKFTPKKFLTSKLKESGISASQAEYAGLSKLSPQESETLGGFHCNGIVFTYYDLNGIPIDYYRIRNDKEHYLEIYEPDGFHKYSQLSNTRSHLYFPKVKSLDWIEIANDSSKTIVITEGEFKSLKATIDGIPTIGLGGVDCWKYRPSGDRNEKSIPIPDFNDFNWANRTVEICFDTDTKPRTVANVKAAIERLAHYLESLGAEVYKVELPL